MAERWRSPAARDLVKAVRAAHGTVERVGRGKLRVTGPSGSVTITEPGGEARRDLRRSAAARTIVDRTGLAL
jgi:hypothetical protein